MPVKQRLDTLLVAKELFDSREKARAAVMAGLVLVDGQRRDKPGYQVLPDCKIKIKGNPLPYVSRGGLKLQRAIQVFDIELTGKIVLDIGASTGGFTDCALQHGASKVYAVDVGYGQLAWSLRQNEQVVVLERTNIRYLDASKLAVSPNFVTIDVSFISLSKVLPKIKELTIANVEIVALIKPQFEAGPGRVGKKGVVRDPAIHREVIKAVLNTAQQLHYQPLGLDYSPVKGPEGNIEYLLYLGLGIKSLAKQIINQEFIFRVVKQAHLEL